MGYKPKGVVQDKRSLDNSLQFSRIAESLIDELQGWNLLGRCGLFRLLEEHEPVLDLPLGMLLQQQDEKGYDVSHGKKNKTVMIYFKRIFWEKCTDKSDCLAPIIQQKNHYERNKSIQQTCLPL